jgi:hypothetical protein
VAEDAYARGIHGDRAMKAPGRPIIGGAMRREERKRGAPVSQSSREQWLDGCWIVFQEWPLSAGYWLYGYCLAGGWRVFGCRSRYTGRALEWKKRSVQMPDLSAHSSLLPYLHICHPQVDMWLSCMFLLLLLSQTYFDETRNVSHKYFFQLSRNYHFTHIKAFE